MILGELKPKVVKLSIRAGRSQLVQGDPQSSKLPTYGFEAALDFVLTGAKDQEVIDISSGDDPVLFKSLSGPAIFDQAGVPRQSNTVEDVAHDRLHSPHCPAPAHRDAGEAVVVPFFWPDVHPSTVLPDSAGANSSSSLGVVKGKVLGKLVRAELVEAVLKISTGFPKRGSSIKPGEVGFSPGSSRAKDCVGRKQMCSIRASSIQDQSDLPSLFPHEGRQTSELFCGR